MAAFLLLASCGNSNGIESMTIEPASTTIASDTKITPNITDTLEITSTPWDHNGLVAPLEDSFFYAYTLKGIYVYHVGCRETYSPCVEFIAHRSVPGSELGNFDISPNGEYAAVGFVPETDAHGAEPQVVVMDLRNGSHLVLADAGSYQPKWSPDSKYLAYVDLIHNRLCLTTIYGLYRCVEQKENISTAPPVWSPSGGQLIYEAGMNLYILDISDGDPIRFTGRCTELTWSPDGYFLACREITAPRLLRVYDIRDCMETNPSCGYYSIDIGEFTKPKWSPDGKYLGLLSIADTNTRHLSVVEAKCLKESIPCKETMNRLSGPVWDVADYVWSPDGQVIAFTINMVEDYFYLMRADRKGMEKVGIDEKFIVQMDWKKDYYPWRIYHHPKTNG